MEQFSTILSSLDPALISNIHLYSPQTVAQQERKNEESNSLTKSCIENKRQ